MDFAIQNVFLPEENLPRRFDWAADLRDREFRFTGEIDLADRACRDRAFFEK